MTFSSRSRRAPGRLARWTIGMLAISLLATSCASDDEGAEETSDTLEVGIEGGLAEAGEPVRGGRIVYALEAETAGGWCLPEATLAPSGHMVRNALYDSLVAINANGEAKPYLATSITSADNNTRWTFTIREGVTFHDESKLDAEVVKDNLDAYRGEYPDRTPDLFPLILAPIETVEVIAPMTVEITTNVPWVALPTYLAPLGIMAQAQLQDTESCERNMIGTGPFELSEWVPNRRLLAQRNPNYWQIAPDGQSYPYADAIEFRPIVEAQQRINAIETQDVNVMASSEPYDIHSTLRNLSDNGLVNLLVANDHPEVGYLLLNSGKPPFNDERMRRALAHGIDRELYNDLINGGFSTLAEQPFPVGDMGYVDDPGFPAYDLDEARRLVAEYTAEGNSPEFTISAASEPNIVARAEILLNQLKNLGIQGKIHSVDEATLINEAIGGEFQAAVWSQHAGGEPDAQYVWWYGPPNPTNFAHIDDPVIDSALDQGRSEPDPAKRRQIYEGVARRFAEKVWNIWLVYSEWGIALAPQVHGVLSVELPDDGGPVFTGIASGHPVHGMWIGDD